MRHLICLAPLALMACVPARPHEEVSGRSAFLESCASRHGVDARGAGVLAGGLDPRPADLTAIAARNGGIFPRDAVMSIIGGFVRGAHFNPAMPEFGETDLGETVIVEDAPSVGTPVPERLLALADYLGRIQEP